MLNYSNNNNIFEKLETRVLDFEKLAKSYPHGAYQSYLLQFLKMDESRT